VPPWALIRLDHGIRCELLYKAGDALTAVLVNGGGNQFLAIVEELWQRFAGKWATSTEQRLFMGNLRRRPIGK